MQPVLDSNLPKLSVDQNRWLLEDFTLEEIRRALKDMSSSKAPGPDGFQASFFQNYWDIVGEDTINIYLKFLNSNMDVGKLNKTFLVLISKQKELV